jgi:uncharacterized protein YecE (DUF72 family)
MNQTRIGCAGWSIDRESAARFPVGDSHLERYAQVLNATEINSSFYRPHQPQTYERWAASVPADFRFSVKLPRTITHDARLAGIDDLLARFAGEANTLGDKLGCVLVQLPPSLALHQPLASEFFQRVNDAFGCAIACEARHASWFSDDATTLLQRHHVTRVIADPPAGQPGPYVATSDTIYARLHGSPRMYYSAYDQAYLDSIAAYVSDKDAWIIFDNTASGAALPNALSLKQQLT